MAEYIEREALIAKMKKLFSPELLQNATEQEISRAAIMLVEYEPAADVAEVKHGKWEKYSHTTDVCSDCRRHVARHRFNYCPWCGAKMDLGDDEE